MKIHRNPCCIEFWLYIYGSWWRGGMKKSNALSDNSCLLQVPRTTLCFTILMQGRRRASSGAYAERMSRGAQIGICHVDPGMCHGRGCDRRWRSHQSAGVLNARRTIRHVRSHQSCGRQPRLESPCAQPPILQEHVGSVPWQALVRHNMPPALSASAARTSATDGGL